MSGQMSLMGFDDAPVRPTDRLFFAVRPNPAVCAQIAAITTRLKDTQGLRGTPVRPERLHATLHHLGDHAGVPQALVDQAHVAAASLNLPAFDVVFDRVVSFARPRNLPLVLRGGAGLDGLMNLQWALGRAMAHAGLGRHVEAHFTPHVTLLYDDKRVDEQPLEPIRWTVDELVLVHSLLGKTVHKTLASWPLKG